MVVIEDRIKGFVDRNYEQFMRKHMGIEPPFKLVSEYTLKNGQQVDKVVIGTDNKILALIECKGEVNLNEFVRGTGQAIQGAFQIGKNLNNDFSENARSFLVVPVEMTDKISLDFFDYHNFSLIFADVSKDITIEYNENNYASTNPGEWVTVNPYYFRDCQLEGVYFYLKFLLKNSGEIDKRNLSEVEKEIREIKNREGVAFFGDVRNNRIVPSVLGFYDQATKTLTIRGYEYSKKSFPEFCKELVLRDFGEYSRVVFLAILSLAKNNEKVTTSQIADFIKNVYEGKKITYLFDPDGQNRDLLTMIRMLETIGAVKRENGTYRINYFPFENMPFLMEEYNANYNEKLKCWFDRFNLPL